jgi:peptide methionine sulfoxide reductase MsrB
MKKEKEYETHFLQRNEFVRFNHNHNMGPTVLAEVSCSADDVHLGYVVGEGPALKTGYGKG